ncbi:MAG: hypothetical protein RSA91_00960 [Bacilli bacterium]
MNKRQNKKIKKQSSVIFKTLDIKHGEVLVIEFNDNFTMEFINYYIASIKKIIPNIHTIVTMKGIRLGKIRGEINGEVKNK